MSNYRTVNIWNGEKMEPHEFTALKIGDIFELVENGKVISAPKRADTLPMPCEPEGNYEVIASFADMKIVHKIYPHGREYDYPITG